MTTHNTYSMLYNDKKPIDNCVLHIATNKEEYIADLAYNWRSKKWTYTLDNIYPPKQKEYDDFKSLVAKAMSDGKKYVFDDLNQFVAELKSKEQELDLDNIDWLVEGYMRNLRNSTRSYIPDLQAYYMGNAARRAGIFEDYEQVDATVFGEKYRINEIGKGLYRIENRDTKEQIEVEAYNMIGAIQLLAFTSVDMHTSSDMSFSGIGVLA